MSEDYYAPTGYIASTDNKITLTPEANAEIITGKFMGIPIVIGNPNSFPILVHEKDGRIEIFDMRSPAEAATKPRP